MRPSRASPYWRTTLQGVLTFQIRLSIILRIIIIIFFFKYNVALFQCDQCNRGFSQKNSLVSHQKAIHGREKPYKCALCPYASSQKGTAIFIKVFFSHYIRFESGNLRAHVRRLHLFAYNEQQGDVHRCEDCSAVFRNVSSLTSHMSKFHCDTEQVCFIELLKISACYRFNCFFFVFFIQRRTPVFPTCWIKIPTPFQF